MRRELPTAARLAAFGAVLASAFGAAYVVGDLAVTDDREVLGERLAELAATVEDGEVEVGTPSLPQPQRPLPVGLAVSSDGYTLRPLETVLPPGEAVPFAFSLIGPDGQPVADLTRAHERDLHLIAARRDLGGFQHVHPERGPDGTWSVPLELTPGTHRVFADFVTPDGQARVLGADLHVPGAFAPSPAPEPSSTDVVDGYRVTLSGVASAESRSLLELVVTRDGVPVTGLQPYLGAYGHLVGLREGDLAYLHAHALDDAVPGETGGPRLSFLTEFPSAGTYRLYLDLQVDGVVRTADFTVEVGPPAGGEQSGEAPPHDAGPHDAEPHDAEPHDAEPHDADPHGHGAGTTAEEEHS